MSSTAPIQDGVAWIAGVGPSAGLGAALARRYARGGLRVALTGRTAARLDTLVAEIHAAGGHAHALPGDVASEPDVQRLGAELQTLGPLRAAVFNAGNAVRGAALELTAQQFEQTFEGGVAFAGAEPGARARAAGHPCRANGCAAGRHCAWPKPAPTACSTRQPLPKPIGKCTCSSAAPGPLSWTCGPSKRDSERTPP